MNELQIFNSEEFGDIRTATIENEPWFVGKDVATALGYAKPLNALSAHVEKDDSLKQGITDSLGREQETIFINESGLYALIFGSKLESAKRFKHWVTSEVLPAIRKTGSYQKPMTTDQKIQLLAQGNQLVQNTDKADMNNLNSVSLRSIGLIHLSAYNGNPVRFTEKIQEIVDCDVDVWIAENGAEKEFRLTPF